MFVIVAVEVATLMTSSEHQSKGSRAVFWVALSCSTQHVAVKRVSLTFTKTTQEFSMYMCCKARILVKITHHLQGHVRKAILWGVCQFFWSNPLINTFTVLLIIQKATGQHFARRSREKNGDIYQFFPQISSTIFWVFNLYSSTARYLC